MYVLINLGLALWCHTQPCNRAVDLRLIAAADAGVARGVDVAGADPSGLGCASARRHRRTGSAGKLKNVNQAMPRSG